MATEADHIALANKNHEALTRLAENPELFPEWITTVAFYKALQIVEAVFANQRIKSCANHTDRLDSIKVRLPEIAKHYRPLWAASTVARYLYDNDQKTPYSKFTDYLPSEKVISKIVEKRLRPIEQLAVGRLSDGAKEALQRISS